MTLRLLKTLDVPLSLLPYTENGVMHNSHQFGHFHSSPEDEIPDSSSSFSVSGEDAFDSSDAYNLFLNFHPKLKEYIAIPYSALSKFSETIYTSGLRIYDTGLRNQAEKNFFLKFSKRKSESESKDTITLLLEFYFMTLPELAPSGYFKYTVELVTTEETLDNALSYNLSYFMSILLYKLSKDGIFAQKDSDVFNLTPLVTKLGEGNNFQVLEYMDVRDLHKSFKVEELNVQVVINPSEEEFQTLRELSKHRFKN